MCSFLLTTILVGNFFLANEKQRSRGPDFTSQGKCGNFFCVHNLLALTGAFKPQPFLLNRDHHSPPVVVLFNGEIYNYLDLYQNATSDGECILPTYEKYGPKFLRYLDGEFAIALVDEDRSIAVIGRDVFGTKPLFLSLKNGLHVASYRSSLELLLHEPHTDDHILIHDNFDRLIAAANAGIVEVPPNTGIVLNRISTSSWEIVETYTVFEFDLRQHKSSTEDWERAFLNAVRKRATHSINSDALVSLSSGLDSGAIQAALHHLKLPYHVYSIIATENEDVLEMRLRKPYIPKTVSMIELSAEDFLAEQQHIKNHAEFFRYASSTWGGGLMSDDTGAVGMSFIARQAKRNRISILLSGGGADETISDYGFNGTRLHPHSAFGGLFPGNLSNVFPWSSFFLGTQRDYIAKEELVGGSHGLEVRFPFLDTMVVQEFLWLSEQFKNSEYKSVVSNFLLKLGYPAETGITKKGFGASLSLRAAGNSKIFKQLDHSARAFLTREHKLIQSQVVSFAMSFEHRNSSQLLHLRGSRPLRLPGISQLLDDAHGGGLSLRILSTLVNHLETDGRTESNLKMTIHTDFSYFREIELAPNGWPIFTLLRYFAESPQWIDERALQEESYLYANLGDLLFGCSEILGRITL